MEAPRFGAGCCTAVCVVGSALGTARPAITR